MKPCIEVEIEEFDDIIVDVRHVPLAVDLDPDEQPNRSTGFLKIEWAFFITMKKS